MITRSTLAPIRFIALALSILVLLTGCFPWPSGQDSDPIDSDTIQSADITVTLSGEMREEDSGDLSFHVLLRGDNRSPIQISDGEYLEIQTLTSDGFYAQSENAVVTDSTSFNLTGFDAPSSYKILFHRATGAVDELLRIQLNAKLETSVTTLAATYGNSEFIDISWDWVAAGLPLDITNPEMNIRYTLNCENDSYFSSMTAPAGTGTESMPFSVPVDDVIMALPGAILPCMVDIALSYYPTYSLDEFLILQSEVGSTFNNAGQIGSDIYFAVHSETYRVSIE